MEKGSCDTIFRPLPRLQPIHKTRRSQKKRHTSSHISSFQPPNSTPSNHTQPRPVGPRGRPRALPPRQLLQVAVPPRAGPHRADAPGVPHGLPRLRRAAGRSAVCFLPINQSINQRLRAGCLALTLAHPRVYITLSDTPRAGHDDHGGGDGPPGGVAADGRAGTFLCVHLDGGRQAAQDNNRHTHVCHTDPTPTPHEPSNQPQYSLHPSRTDQHDTKHTHTPKKQITHSTHHHAPTNTTQTKQHRSSASAICTRRASARTSGRSCSAGTSRGPGRTSRRVVFSFLSYHLFLCHTISVVPMFSCHTISVVPFFFYWRL